MAPDGSRAARLVLRAGLALSLLLLGSGVLLRAFAGGPAHAVTLTQLLSDPSLGDRVLMAGALVLALTPVAQIVVLLVAWWRLRDYRYAAVAATVIALLAAGAMLGIAH